MSEVSRVEVEGGKERKAVGWAAGREWRRCGWTCHVDSYRWCAVALITPDSPLAAQRRDDVGCLLNVLSSPRVARGCGT